MVHRRELDGTELMFGVHGALWGNAMTWWDHDTGSIWSQPIGEAIVGPRAGARLELFPSTFTTWGAWRESYPDTIALDVPAGTTRFDLDGLLIVVDFTSDTSAYRVEDLRRIGVANDVVAGLEIAVVIDPENPQRWSVFSRRLDATTVVLEIRGDALVDAGTGTTWDPVRGIGLAGPLAGEILDLLPGFTSFPGDYPTFFPEGRVWQP